MYVAIIEHPMCVVKLQVCMYLRPAKPMAWVIAYLLQHSAGGNWSSHVQKDFV